MFKELFRVGNHLKTQCEFDLELLKSIENLDARLSAVESRSELMHGEVRRLTAENQKIYQAFDLKKVKE